MTDETTGTPGQEGGDAAEQTPTTGTPAADGRDAQGGEPDYKALHLANKQTIEELKKRLDAIQEDPPQPPAAEDQGDDDDADWDQVRAWAAKGDATSKLLLKEREQREALAKAIVYKSQLDSLPESERRDALNHFQRHRNRFGDPLAAAADLRAKKLSDEVATLREELRKLSKKPDPDVVRTHDREVSAPEAKDKIRRADWHREQKQLEDEGRHKERMARQRLVRDGALKIID